MIESAVDGGGSPDPTQMKTDNYSVRLSNNVSN